MEEMLIKARKDLSKAESEFAKASTALQRAEATVNQLRAVVDWLSTQLGQNDSQPSNQKTRPKEGTHSAKLINAAIWSLEATGKPMSIAQLAKSVEEMGLEIGGSKSNATLAGYLSRDDRVAFRRELGGWVLTEKATSARNTSESETVEAPEPSTVADLSKEF